MCTWYHIHLFTVLFAMIPTFSDRFAFDIYDADSSGALSPMEVLQMFHDIFGKDEIKANQHARM